MEKIITKNEVKRPDLTITHSFRNIPDYPYKSLKGVKVLIAEDNEVNTLMAKKFLQKWDINADSAENGVVAFEKVKKNDYDIILMDLQMPELDGYGATKLIRRLDGDKYKLVPIIALTASEFMDIQDQAFQSGMNDYLIKPFVQKDLYKIILRHT